MTNELQKDVKRYSRGIVWANVPAFTWKTEDNDKLGEDNRIPGRNSKQEFSDFEDEALAIRPLRPVARLVHLD